MITARWVIEHSVIKGLYSIDWVYYLPFPHLLYRWAYRRRN